MATFSAVIPTFNRSALIRETLDSILAQNRPFEEVIVVDDGSTDDTAQVMAARYPACCYIVQPHGQVQRARNTGIAAANGDWVVFCDSDDLLTPDHLAQVADLIADNCQLDMVYVNHRTFGPRRLPLADRFANVPEFWTNLTDVGTAFLGGGPALVAKLVSVKGLLWPTGLAVKRGFFDVVGKFDERMAGSANEDYEFTVRALASGQAGFLKRPLARIREHEHNVSNLGSFVHLRASIDVLQFALDHHAHARMDPLRQALNDSLDRHRHHYLYEAFRMKDWQALRCVSTELYGRPLSAKQRLKVAIGQLPGPVRDCVHRLVKPILSQADQ